jgi:hypothetical protein
LSCLVFSGLVLSCLLFSCGSFLDDFDTSWGPFWVKSGALAPGRPKAEQGKSGGCYILPILGGSGRENVHFMMGKCNFWKNDAKKTTSFAEDKYHENKRLV